MAPSSPREGIPAQPWRTRAGQLGHHPAVPGPSHPPTPWTLGGALGVRVTWTGSPRWAAVPPPAGCRDSRSSSSSPWRGAGSGTERLKRPPRQQGGRSRGRSAPARGRGQANAGPGGRPEAAMFPQTAPRPGAAGEREDPAAPLRRRRDVLRWRRPLALPLGEGGDGSWGERVPRGCRDGESVEGGKF